MLIELLNRLNHDWLPQPMPEPLTALKAAGSTGQARKVNFLVFTHQTSQPLFLLKVVRERKYNDLLASEYEKLMYLHAHVALQTSVPQPVGLFSHGETLVMVETCLPGISLENLMWRGRRRSQKEVIAAVGNVESWLIEFHSETTEGETTFLGGDEVDKRINGLQEHLNTSLIKELNAIAKDSRGLTIPLTARHGDFWPGNLLVTADGMGVIDWETLSRAVSPFDDMFFFAVMYALRYQKGMFGIKSVHERFSNAFLYENDLARTLVGLMRAVTHSLGVNAKLCPLFFVLFLLDMASDRTHFGHAGGKSELPWADFLAQIHSMNDLVLSR
jgi:hypothetical protein